MNWAWGKKLELWILFGGVFLTILFFSIRPVHAQNACSGISYGTTLSEFVDQMGEGYDSKVAYHSGRASLSSTIRKRADNSPEGFICKDSIELQSISVNGENTGVLIVTKANGSLITFQEWASKCSAKLDVIANASDFIRNYETLEKEISIPNTNEFIGNVALATKNPCNRQISLDSNSLGIAPSEIARARNEQQSFEEEIDKKSKDFQKMVDSIESQCKARWASANTYQTYRAKLIENMDAISGYLGVDAEDLLSEFNALDRDSDFRIAVLKIKDAISYYKREKNWNGLADVLAQLQELGNPPVIDPTLDYNEETETLKNPGFGEEGKAAALNLLAHNDYGLIAAMEYVLSKDKGEDIDQSEAKLTTYQVAQDYLKDLAGDSEEYKGLVSAANRGIAQADLEIDRIQIEKRMKRAEELQAEAAQALYAGDRNTANAKYKEYMAEMTGQKQSCWLGVFCKTTQTKQMPLLMAQQQMGMMGGGGMGMGLGMMNPMQMMGAGGSMGMGNPFMMGMPGMMGAGGMGMTNPYNMMGMPGMFPPGMMY